MNISYINEQFRERMYEFLKTTLSPAMTKDDQDIIIHLLSLIVGDHDFELYRMQYYTMIDYTPTERLRQLGSNVAFPWSNALTPEQQRLYIKLYHLIRKRRSTPWSIENLCRVWGQDFDSYYTTPDLAHVRLFSYPETYGGDVPVGGDGFPLPFCYARQGGPLYPGDNVLRIPAMSTILKKEIFKTLLAGTRLEFLYYFLMGPFHMWPYTAQLRQTRFVFRPRYGFDEIKIGDLQSRIPTTDQPTRIIKYMENWQTSHHVVNYNVTASMVMKMVAGETFDTGWIFTVVDTPHKYRGYFVNDFTMISEEVLRR